MITSGVIIVRQDGGTVHWPSIQYMGSHGVCTGNLHSEPIYIVDIYIFPILNLMPSGRVAYTSNPDCLEIKAGGA